MGRGTRKSSGAADYSGNRKRHGAQARARQLHKRLDPALSPIEESLVGKSAFTGIGGTERKRAGAAWRRNSFGGLDPCAATGRERRDSRVEFPTLSNANESPPLRRLD